jgi:hypothetical protein
MPIKVTTIHTPLLADEVLLCLQAIVGRERSFWRIWATPEAAFEGVVTQGSFRITRAIQYRNSFLPVIWGKVEPVATGSEVRLVMALHPLVALLLVAMPMMFLPSLNGLTTHGTTLGRWVLPLSILSVVCIAFFAETGKAERLIRQCISGTTGKPGPR